MSEQTEEEYLIERLSKLLAEISVIVNGPQPMGVLWSYADLPQKVQALKDAAALNAQAGVVEALRPLEEALESLDSARRLVTKQEYREDRAMRDLESSARAAIAAVKEKDRG